MAERTHLDRRLDALVDIGNIRETERAENGVITATLVGSAPAELDGADANDVERIEHVDVWGDANVLSRPADPTDAGDVEALFVRGGDTREIIGTKDRRWVDETPLEPGEVVLRWCGDINPPSIGMGGGGGGSGPSARPIVHLKANGDVRIAGVKLAAQFDDDATLDAGGDVTITADGTITIHGAKVVVQSDDVRLTADGATDAIALASKVDDRNDAVARALDALCGAVPVSMDGGAALQAAVRAVWTGAMPTGVPTASSDVGSDKIKAS